MWIMLLGLGAVTSVQAADEYCLVQAQGKFLSRKVTITVDYGERYTQAVENEAGKWRKFNSAIDALNYMSAQGWEYVDGYVIPVAGVEVRHYLMKRELEPAATRSPQRLDLQLSNSNTASSSLTLGAEELGSDLLYCLRADQPQEGSPFASCKEAWELACGLEIAAAADLEAWMTGAAPSIMAAQSGGIRGRCLE